MMLAGHGTYKGVQILKPETVALMMVDQTTAEVRGKGLFFPGQGMGFGLGMSLVIDDTKQRPGNGTFSWNGVAGTEWWYDPKNDLSQRSSCSRTARCSPNTSARTAPGSTTPSKPGQ